MKKFILLLLLTSVMYSQPADTLKNKFDYNKKVEIELTDGNSFVGYITSRDSSFIYFKSIGGIEQKIPLEMITEINRIEGYVVNGEYWFEDPNGTRLFLGPTARPIGNKKGFFSAYEIFFPLVGFGITDYVSLAAGISLIPGIEKQMVYMTAKVTPFRTKGFDAAAGVHYITVLGDDDLNTAILFTVFTYGSRDNAVTLGGGVDVIPAERPVFAYYPAPPQQEKFYNYYFTLGGELRISSVAKLITENYYIVHNANGELIFSGGLRFFGKHIAGDFGFVTNGDMMEMGSFPFLPWLGFTYNW